MDLPPRGCFVLAAIGTAGRDLFYFYVLRDDLHPISYGAITVSTVAACALLAQGTCSLKRADPRCELRLVGGLQWLELVVLGLLCAYIYTYFWVTILITPGLFNLLDFGVTPLLTLIIAGAAFAESIHWIRYAVLLLYGIGLLFFYQVGFGTPGIVLIALTYPLATVLSDVLAKHLVGRRVAVGADLLLLSRFGLATPILLVVACNALRDEDSGTVFVAILSAIVLGYVPLRLLLLGLRGGTLRDLAVADMLIPVVTFIGSTPVLLRDPRWQSWTGVAIVIAAFVLQFGLQPETRKEAKDV